LDFRRAGLSPALSLLMSTFSLPITPPDPSQAGFTVSSCICATASLLERGFPRRSLDGITNTELRHGTLRYRVHPKVHTLSFGSWLEPRYIFAARQLV
jgi:hypothetical protein